MRVFLASHGQESLVLRHFCHRNLVLRLSHRSDMFTKRHCKSLDELDERDLPDDVLCDDDDIFGEPARTGEKYPEIPRLTRRRHASSVAEDLYVDLGAGPIGTLPRRKSSVKQGLSAMLSRAWRSMNTLDRDDSESSPGQGGADVAILGGLRRRKSRKADKESARSGAKYTPVKRRPILSPVMSTPVIEHVARAQPLLEPESREEQVEARVSVSEDAYTCMDLNFEAFSRSRHPGRADDFVSAKVLPLKKRSGATPPPLPDPAQKPKYLPLKDASVAKSRSLSRSMSPGSASAYRGIMKSTDGEIDRPPSFPRNASADNILQSVASDSAFSDTLCSDLKAQHCASARTLTHRESTGQDRVPRPPLSNSSSIEEDVSYFCCSPTRAGSRHAKSSALERKSSTLPHEPVVITQPGAASSKSSRLKKKLGGYAFWKPKGMSSGAQSSNKQIPTADEKDQQATKNQRENEYQTLGPGDKPKSRSKSFDSKKGKKIDAVLADSGSTVSRTQSIAGRGKPASPLPPIPMSHGGRSAGPRSPVSPTGDAFTTKSPPPVPSGCRTLRSPPPLPSHDHVGPKPARSSSFTVQRAPLRAVSDNVPRPHVESWYRKKCEDFDYDIPNGLPANKYRLVRQGSRQILVPLVGLSENTAILSHGPTDVSQKPRPFLTRKSKSKLLSSVDPGSPGGRSQRSRSGGETELPRFDFDARSGQTLARHDSNRRRSSFPVSVETDDYAEITEEDLYNMPSRE